MATPKKTAKPSASLKPAAGKAGSTKRAAKRPASRQAAAKRPAAGRADPQEAGSSAAASRKRGAGNTGATKSARGEAAPNAARARKTKTPSPPARYDDLRAVFINCTLKPARGDEPSHTERLIRVAAGVMRANGVGVDIVRAVDLELAPGVQPDMTRHGAARDDWPALSQRVMDADILVLCTPIWLGEESSVCRRVIERLYSESGKLNRAGQYAFYGRVGGCLVTGNEDGIKHCAMSLLYAMQHVGYTIPPQADAGWIGEAGPGPSYGDDGAGYDNDFTQRNTTFMAWNLMHLARMLRDAGGLPAYGNQRRAWDAGARFDHPGTDER